MSANQVERLRSEGDFAAVYEAGKSWVMPGAVLYAKPSGTAITRVGFVAGKRLGPAVARNRAKRLLREAFRQVVGRQPMAGGFDLVFVARGRLLFQRWDEILDTMATLLSRARVHERRA
jgi:ribonuclease P protein component